MRAVNLNKINSRGFGPAIRIATDASAYNRPMGLPGPSMTKARLNRKPSGSGRKPLAVCQQRPLNTLPANAMAVSTSWGSMWLIYVTSHSSGFGSVSPCPLQNWRNASNCLKNSLLLVSYEGVAAFALPPIKKETIRLKLDQLRIRRVGEPDSIRGHPL